MTDKREQILERIKTILETVSGFNTVLRNPPRIDDDTQDCLILLDGREDGGAAQAQNQRTAKPAPIVMVMAPEIVISKSESADSAGQGLNAARAEILKAIMADAALLNLTLNKTMIEYTGCETGFTMAKKIASGMQLNFAITYLVKISDL